MKYSLTGINQASKNTPLILRGSDEFMIQETARLGYDGIELHIKDPSVTDEKVLEKLLRKNNVGLSAIGTGPSYSQEHVFLTHNDPSVRALALERMKQFIRLGSSFHAAVIVGLIKGQIKDCGSLENYETRLDASMIELLDLATQYNVNLVFEVIDRYESDILNTIDEGLAYINQYKCDNLLLHLDTFHMNIEETDCAAAIRRARGKVGHFHVADSNRWYPGVGHYDFKSTMQALKDIDYQQYLSLESFNYPSIDVSSQGCLSYLKNIEANLN